MIRQRKILRKRNFDYSTNCKYFITICTKYRIHHFGYIKKNEMIYTQNGLIAKSFVENISNHFEFCSIDSFIVMPNHVHMVVSIDDVRSADEWSVMKGPDIVGSDVVGSDIVASDVVASDIVGSADLRTLSNNNNSNPMDILIPKIIHQFKSSVTRTIRKQFNNYEFAWQKSYHDSIIRDKTHLKNVLAYIQNNPIAWNKDIHNK